MAKVFKFDHYQKEARRTPFVLEGPFPEGHPANEANGGPDSITIPVPTGARFIEAEVAQGVGGSLRVLCGDQWPQIEPLLEGVDPGGVMELLRDLMTHFGVGDEFRPPGDGPHSST
jgi:hypothetical protein